MKLSAESVKIEDLAPALRSEIYASQGRLGLLSSIDGKQLITLILYPKTGTCAYWETPLDQSSSYNSLTAVLPQTHWYERINWELFGICADGHPRLKPVRLNEPYPVDFFPMRAQDAAPAKRNRTEIFQFVEVTGEGVYEVPVGPIHAGVIEPGHFRLACLGETIVNLELKLGWLHRGVEKRITEVPWQNARFVAEGAATDTAIGNALAHSIAVESLFDVEIPPLAQALRSMALEIERAAMHIIDIGGIAGDLGFLPVLQNLSRLRGVALGFGQTLTGQRLQKGFVKPGGVLHVNTQNLSKIQSGCKTLKQNLKPLIGFLQDHHRAIDRMSGVGVIRKSLAQEFGLVGVMARASGIEYDSRQHFCQGRFPEQAPPIALESTGDVLARTNIRINELWNSLDSIEREFDDLPSGPCSVALPKTLPKNAIGTGIVEAFRGELIHLVVTDESGAIKRYVIKDPSCNNWAGSSIANRHNLIADFPLCNKSMALSYGGNDL